VIYLLKSYTSSIVNIKCFEHRQCEIFQQFKMPFTQSLRSALLNIAISVRQKCGGDYLSDILQIVKSCDDAYALAISLFYLLSFGRSRDVTTAHIHFVHIQLTQTRRTIRSIYTA